jgi:hypothetical protein
VYVYSNTVYGNSTGINHAACGDVLFFVKNNISYDNVQDYANGCGDAFNSASTNNLSKDATAPAFNTYYRNKTISFINVSTSTGSENFHLAPTDSDAIGMGADLSSDPNLPFATDIDGQTRTAPWSIGADDLDVAPPVLSGGSPTGILVAGTTSASLSLTTNEIATCRYSTLAGIAYASMTNAFTNTTSTSHSTTVSGLTNGNSYTYYVRCIDQSGNPTTSDYSISFSVSNPDLTPPTPGTISLGNITATTITATTTGASDNIALAPIHHGCVLRPHFDANHLHRTDTKHQLYL